MLHTLHPDQPTQWTCVLPDMGQHGYEYMSCIYNKLLKLIIFMPVKVLENVLSINELLSDTLLPVLILVLLRMNF